MKNYGVILEDPKVEDYRFGGYSAVKNEVLVVDGNWSMYLPDNEVQRSVYFDSLACVSFSATNIVETLFNYYIKNKLISIGDMQWLSDNGYISETGLINFSDRFTAKMSGTTKKGNTGYNVARSIRKDGLVPESKYDYPIDQKNPVFSWANYYQPVPDKLVKLGKEFLRRFEVQSEVVYEADFDRAILSSPIQVYVYAWAEKDGVYYTPEGSEQNHAVMKQVVCRGVYDSYDPFIKKLVDNFDYYYHGYKYNIIFKNKKIMRLVKTKDNEDVYLVDAQGNKRFIIDESHFRSLIPALGLGVDEDDWSQIEVILEEEMAKFKEERPIFVAK